jgi:hypothetical protein
VTLGWTKKAWLSTLESFSVKPMIKILALDRSSMRKFAGNQEQTSAIVFSRIEILELFGRRNRNDVMRC